MASLSLRDEVVHNRSDASNRRLVQVTAAGQVEATVPKPLSDWARMA